MNMDSKKQIKPNNQVSVLSNRGQFRNKSTYIKKIVTIKSDVTILILGKPEFYICLNGKERYNSLPGQCNMISIHLL